MAWKNWAGNQKCNPAEVAHPSTDAELAAVVKSAAARGRTVKVVGSGHSFTACALTDGVQIVLDRYKQVSVDPVNRTVTAQAGATIAELNKLLEGYGMAMPNLGDIAYQTISGAISTVDPRHRRQAHRDRGTSQSARNRHGRRIDRVVLARRREGHLRVGPRRRRCSWRPVDRSRCSACQRSTSTPSKNRCASTTCSKTSTPTSTPTSTSNSSGCRTRVGRSPRPTTRPPSPPAARAGSSSSKTRSSWRTSRSVR